MVEKDIPAEAPVVPPAPQSLLVEVLFLRFSSLII
jgi:hypothetical protein